MKKLDLNAMKTVRGGEGWTFELTVNGNSDNVEITTTGC